MVIPAKDISLCSAHLRALLQLSGKLDQIKSSRKFPYSPLPALYILTVVVRLAGAAIHEGGSCQASISEDKGATFKVVKSYIGQCPVQGGGSFDFNVPKETKSGEVIFAWSWFNRVGNREMYMNCAVVTITNGGSGLHNYPDIFVANLDNTCGTDEGFDVYFPKPGTPDRVVNLSSSSHSPHGACAPPKRESMATTVATETTTLTKTSFATIDPTPSPNNTQPICECKCVEPGQNSGYIVNISPFAL